jgi:hypothetical protein
MDASYGHVLNAVIAAAFVAAASFWATALHRSSDLDVP